MLEEKFQVILILIISYNIVIDFTKGIKIAENTTSEQNFGNNTVVGNKSLPVDNKNSSLHENGPKMARGINETGPVLYPNAKNLSVKGLTSSNISNSKEQFDKNIKVTKLVPVQENFRENSKVDSAEVTKKSLHNHRYKNESTKLDSNSYNVEEQNEKTSQKSFSSQIPKRNAPQIEKGFIATRTYGDKAFTISSKERLKSYPIINSSQIPKRNVPPLIEKDFVASKPFSEKVFIPSPEVKFEPSASLGEPQNFDSFQPIHPVNNIAYNNNIKNIASQIEPKQELHHHIHHFIDTPAHKLEQDLSKNLHHDQQALKVIHVPPHDKDREYAAIFVDQHASGGVVFPTPADDYEHHLGIKHHYESNNWHNTHNPQHYHHAHNIRPYQHDEHQVNNNNEAEDEKTDVQNGHVTFTSGEHSAQVHLQENYNQNHNPLLISEVPPAPVTEDVKETVKTDHPYPFEVVKDHNVKCTEDPLEKHHHPHNPHHYHQYRDESEEIKAVIEKPLPHTTPLTPHGHIEIWNDYKLPPHVVPHDHKPIHGKLVPKRETWKDIVQVLSTIIPIGLLISALTPNVVIISPNATAPTHDRSPWSFQDITSSFFSKKRSTGSKIRTNVHNELLTNAANQLSNKLKNLPPGSKCIERIFCELSRNANESNTSQLQELLQMIVNRSHGLKQIEDSISDLFEMAKTNNCSKYDCEDHELG